MLNFVQNANRWHAITVLHRRERRGLLYGIGLYVTVFIALMASVLFLRNQFSFTADNGLAVMSRPLILPFFFSMMLAATYLALVAATSIAREREQGTLEVLFYGPIDYTAYVVGKFMTPLLACLAVVLLDLVWAWAFARLSNFSFSLDLIPVAALAALCGATLVAFSILVSALTRSARAAIIVLLLVIIVLAAIQFGYDALATLAPPAEPNRVNPLIFLRDALGWLNQIISWLSPYAYLNDGIDALVSQDVSGYLRTVGLSLLALLAYLAAAVRMMERRGVRG